MPLFVLSVMSYMTNSVVRVIQHCLRKANFLYFAPPYQACFVHLLSQRCKNSFVIAGSRILVCFMSVNIFLSSIFFHSSYSQIFKEIADQQYHLFFK